MKTGGSIVAVLTNPVLFAYLDKPPDASIRIGNEVFEDVGLGEYVGFYDWLRRPDGRLIGVRTWFARDSKTRNLQRQFSSCSAVEFDEDNFRIYFSKERQFSPELSDDQELGMHRIASSSDGVLLATYDIAMLTDDELANLRQDLGLSS